MDLQGRELKVEMQGPDVTLLQAELRDLHYDIPAQEVRFGQKTLAAVIDVQKKVGLPQSGIVNVITAKTINRLVDVIRQVGSLLGTVRNEAAQPISGVQIEVLGTGLRAATSPQGQFRIAQVPAGNQTVRAAAAGFQTQQLAITVVAGEPQIVDFTLVAVEPAKWVVRGRVVKTGGPGIPAVKVTAFQIAGTDIHEVGEKQSGDDGRYEIEYAPRGGPVNLDVKAYTQEGDELGDSGLLEGVAKVQEGVDVPVTGDGGNGGADLYVVHGVIDSPDHAAVAGLDVRIVDKGVGPDVDLTATISDARGRFKATFAASKVQGKDRPDIQARVFAGQAFVGASSVRYNAGTVEALDVHLSAGAIALPSEHETLTGALQVHYKGALGDLKETVDRPNISYLANKIGWDARAIAFAALADQFARNGAGAAPIPAPLYYALFRAGLPANPDTLYKADVQTVTRIWKQAIAQGVIPKELEANLPAAAKRFQDLGATTVLDSRVPGTPSTIKDLVQLAFGNDAQRQKTFAQLYTELRADPPKFWTAIEKEFGPQVTKRLKLDGQLGFLTLNNAPLINRTYAAAAAVATPLTASIDLVTAGFYRAERWTPLLVDPIPDQIPGPTQADRVANYAELLAAQVRLSFPTAVVAQRVKSGELPINGADNVHAFLMKNQGKFEIGMQPIQQYINRNKNNPDAQPPEPVKVEIKRLQRLYQITPTDQAMGALLRNKLDSAYQIVRYGENKFVNRFKGELGSESHARLTYAKARQVHNAVLNVATTYLVARTAAPIGVHSPAQVLDGGSTGDPTGGDVIAYPTLEGLFGSMDYCACDHCRSILSPAAYLVNLLQFSEDLDPAAPFENPQSVLLERRPDVRHLPLTCENTNTPLPYIDVVNETLEYYITHNLSLAGYIGHDTESAATAAELLASPQFVSDAAYDALKLEFFPPPLPFHRPLELLRRHFEKLEIPLEQAMEGLRAADDLERANAASYGWRDILMERLKLSRAEYRLLTDRTIGVAPLYGYPPATTEAQAMADLANLKAFTRRMGITYADVVAVLKTKFVNPNSTLIPRLERLHVTFATLKRLKDGTIPDADFDALLPAGLDLSEYDGDVKAWVRNNDNYNRIMGLITIANPTASNDLCSIDALEFRYADPNNAANAIRKLDYVRLLRFIRLWKKLGWTIEQTDKAITALYPVAQVPTAPDEPTNLQRLDGGFLILLPRLGIVRQVMDRLKLKVKNDLLGLLTCWSRIDYHGADSLYRRTFLNRALLEQDDAFYDDGYGNVPKGQADGLLNHVEALRAASGLKGDEFSLIVDALGLDNTTLLTLDNISAIYRRAWLARKLRLSVREFLLLTKFAKLDPFASPDVGTAPNPAKPPVVRLIELMEALRAAKLKPTQVLYVLWNQDLSGKSAPAEERITGFARAVRGQFAAVESEFTLTDDPTGDIARARMELVYGTEATDFLFGLLTNTYVTEVSYTHPEPTLDQAILDVAPGRIGYDDLRKVLFYTGVLTVAVRDALKGVPGTTLAFRTAMDTLLQAYERNVAPFFARYPELGPLLTAYVVSADPPAKKRKDLLASFLPELKRRRKRQQGLASLTAAARTDEGFGQALLDDAAVLHAAAHNDRPALDDLTALESPGLSAQFFWRATATGNVDGSSDTEPTLDYTAAGPTKLPRNPTAGDPISGIWSGYLEAPENGFYNILIDADATAAVTLTREGVDEPLARNGTLWSNQNPIALTAGVLQQVTLKVEKTRDTLRVRWETTGRGREVIPAQYLYSATLMDHMRAVYIRFLKTVSLATGLKLTPNEIAYLAAHADFAIGGQGWPNALALFGDADPAIWQPLSDILRGLLDYARLKADLAPDDERLLAVLQDPTATVPNGDPPLLSLTGWNGDYLTDLLARIGKAAADLIHIDVFRSVSDSFALITKSGVPAAALFEATINEPDADIVRGFQSALRARYDQADWLELIRPINDTMRGCQRDALVAYILRKMKENQNTKSIDTADKLFEYFLMDVKMEPCMLTSRIRHALSSVQLFIERCLMNLEPRVAPSSIDSAQWQWMKRYRVWEANRKVFLWPENWLEPELRDDQSPFFKEVMSGLLEGDITEDAASIALLNYLSKLEDVAKLEPCGFHYVEGDPDTVHVVARTAGAHRKYYYRRREFGNWTPWDPMKLDIEDNPVVPVVWRDRLLLVWLKVFKQGPQAVQKAGSDDSTLGNLKVKDISLDAKITVRAALCWSEYYNGKWQPMKTSDVERPVKIGDYDRTGDGAFDRSILRLDVTPGNSGLDVNIAYAGGAAWFFLFNTHSVPLSSEDPAPALLASGVAPATQLRYMSLSAEATPPPNTLFIGYRTTDNIPPYYNDTWLNRSLLTVKEHITFQTVDPRHPLQSIWDAPFFYQDGRHVFYVKTTEQLVTIADYSRYGVLELPWRRFDYVQLPPLVIEPDPLLAAVRGQGAFTPAGTNPGVVDPQPLARFVTEDVYIRTAIGTTAAVQYGNRPIGPSGALNGQRGM